MDNNISWKESSSSRNIPPYKIYKVANQLPPSLNPGDIIISLQAKTIHFMDIKDGQLQLQLWEGNAGRNMKCSHNRAILWWNGTDICWVPPSTRSRYDAGHPNLRMLGVEEIITAIQSPPPIQSNPPIQSPPPNPSSKRRRTGQTSPTGPPTKLQKSISQSHQEIVPATSPPPESPSSHIPLPGHSLENTDAYLSDQPLPSTDHSSPRSLQAEFQANNLGLQPTFSQTYDDSWTSQSCVLDAMEECPMGNPSKEWEFNGLKTISPINASVSF